MMMNHDLSAAALAMKIRDEYRLAEMTAASSLNHLIEVGELLTQAKAKIEHGGWESWVSANLPFGIRQAQRYMRLYERRDELESKATCETLLGMNNALALIANERPEQQPDQEPQTTMDSEQDSTASESPHPARHPKIEVIPPHSIEDLEAEDSPVRSQGSRKAFPACGRFKGFHGPLWHLSRDLALCKEKGWRTQEQREEVIATLECLLDQARRIGGAR